MRQRAGDTRSGGVFNLNETQALKSIFPLTLTKASEFRIMAQVYQGLVSFDPRTLEIKPCLASSWEVDRTATEYTFHLREGVRFHDDPAFPDGAGREVDANDVLNCYTAICTAGRGDLMFWLFQDLVEGANMFYDATAHGEKPAKVEGFDVIDEHTLRISLTHPSPNFLQIIAHQGCWIWPHELIDTYGKDPAQNAIGTGPFKLQGFRPGEVMVMSRNDHYWNTDEEGNALPYLDAVRVTFDEDKHKEFDEFLKGHVTALFELSVDQLRSLGDSIAQDGRARFHLRTMPALSTQFYGFDLRHVPFSDRRVREAFALAIDRRIIIDSVLKGRGAAAFHGIVAPGLADYPYDSVRGVPFEPTRARALLAEAGYPDGNGFPPIQLQSNAEGFGYVQVAEAVQEMLQQVLNVPVSVSVLRGDQHFDRVDFGLVRLWREGWTADHPDAENFLALLYGKNAVLDTALPASINKTRYHSAEFDAWFRKARTESDPKQRALDLAKAEAIAMDDMPVIPLYHEDATLLCQPWVHGLYLNAIEFLDLSGVWFDKPTDPL